MNRLTYFVVVTALLSPARVICAPALALRSLGWGDTRMPSSGDLYMDCANPTDATLVVSFSAPPGVQALTGVDLNIDFCTLPYWLPEWWQFELLGGCRNGALTVSADFRNGPSTHLDPWGGSATVQYTFTPGYMSPVRARIQISVSIDPAMAQPLTANAEYYAVKLIFAASSGPCTGCTYPACFVINDEMYLYHSLGTTFVASSGYDNYARWQGGQGDCPFIISVEPQSWGGVKSLYR